MSEEIQKRSVTLRDLAAAANVHHSTISRALRNDPRVRPETREAVQALARKLQYRPNPYLTALATQIRTRREPPGHATVAILDTCSTEVWSSAYEAGIRGRAADHGFSIETLNTIDLPGGVEEAGRIIDARGIRGLVILPVRDQPVLTGIDFRSLACATIDPSLQSPLLHRACADYFQGMRTALGTLHARRYRRIGFCTTRMEVRRIGIRWLGAYLAWQEQGHPEETLRPHVSSIRDVDDVDDRTAAARHWTNCRGAFAQWLEQEKPDAIISNGFYTEQWLKELGLGIPGNIGFAALNVQRGDTVHSGIRQQSEQVGAAAMDIIANQICRNEYGLPLVPTAILVPPAWTDGATTL